MNQLYYGVNLAILRSCGIAIPTFLSCSACPGDESNFGANELATFVKPCVPAGWTISVRDTEVIQERSEKVEIYNSIAMPRLGQVKEIKRRMRRDKLSITF
jgi:hypothetical protein